MASVRKREWVHNGAAKTAWVVAYTDQGGKRRLKTFDKKKDADSYRTRVEGEIERGEHVAPSQSIKVVDASKIYFRDCEHRHREGIIGRARLQAIEGTLRVHIVPTLGRVLFADMIEAQVESWYRDLPDSLSLRSRRAYLQELCNFETFARRKKFTTRQPARDFRASLRGSKGRTVIRTFTADAVRALLMAAEKRAHYGKTRAWRRLRLSVHLAVFCGLRRGEIYGLTLGSIDFTRRVIRVRHSVTQWGELKGPKTEAGNRDVPMPDHVAGMLAEWIERHYVANERELVLTIHRGTGHKAGLADFTKSHQAEWRALLIRAGLHDAKHRAGAGLHFHALRHFASSWYLAQGMSPSDVAKLLGHSTFDMTLQVYAHPVYDDSYRQAAINAGALKLLSLTDATTARQEALTT